jgi:Zn-dependent M28 family amino/carboxypeptidase
VRSVLRILFTAAIAILILFLGATAVIRQPLLTHRKPTGHDPADARGLEAHVRFLTAHPNQPVVTDYIAQRFREAGGIVEVQEFSARRQTWRNVIAHFGPRDSTPPLVIGAHHDTLFSRPGADDNASGVAGLLELARLLGKHPPRTPVTLVAYANEEPPFFGSAQMGSAVHAASVKRVRGMISLEMIGYFHGEQQWTSWVLSLMYPHRSDFIAVGGGWRDRVLARHVKRAMNAADANAVSFTGPREMLDASDQRNYWARGWPAVIITDTAYLRNPNYHTVRDTADTLDYARMAKVIDGVFEAAISF